MILREQVDLDPWFDEIIANKPDNLIGLQLELTYHEAVSNSHSCPKTGVRNFGSHSDKPMSYPGMTGRIWLRYREPPKTFMPPIGSALHTGTGGYGSYANVGCGGKWGTIALLGSKDLPKLHYYSYDCKVFIDDFKEHLQPLADAYEEQFLIDKLMRSYQSTIYNPTYHYYHLDKDVEKADQELIERWNTNNLITTN